jgi:hypothetical protein
VADPLDILTGRPSAKGDDWTGTLANIANVLASIPERRARDAQRRMEMDAAQLKLQTAQQQADDLKALDAAFAQPGGRDTVLSQLPGHLRGKVAQQFAELDESNAKRQKAREEARQAADDTIARGLTVVKSHDYDPLFAQGTISTLKTYYQDDPDRLKELQLVEAAIHENPTRDHVRMITDALIARSPTQRKAENEAAKAALDQEAAQQKIAGTEPIQPVEAARLEADASKTAATLALTEAQRKEQAQHNRALEAASFGNLAVARAREAREAEKPQGSDKPPTGQQRRALGFFNRARQADEDINAVEDEVSKMGVVGSTWMKRMPNLMQTETGQKYNQAQRAFTEARLRKDSGATIKDSEYEQDRKTYFAEPGDNAATLEQKRRARAQLLASLGAEAGASALREFYGDEGDTLVQSYRERSEAKAKATEKKNPYR